MTGTPLSNLSFEYRVGLDQYRENANRQMPIGSSAGYLTGFSQQVTQDVLLVNNDVAATHTMSMDDFGFTSVAGFSHQYFEATSGDVSDGLPIVVLVNRYSASAAEIVAGALHDYKRATLIGEKTFGKGTVQDRRQLDGGGGIHVTIARWLLPGGSSIQDGGLPVDVEAKDDPETPEDEVVNKAMELGVE